ncbi:hypothetical protein [Chitinophaga pollutisoli]
MVKIRQEKVDKIADHIPLQDIEVGPEKGKVLVLGWGSTFGAIKSAVLELLAEGHEVAHAHIRYLRPFPRNLDEILHSYDHVLIPEINNGQLIKIIREQFLIPAKGYNKVMGVPITKGELVEKIRELL